MTGATRAPTYAEALHLAQQVQNAERQLKEACERHADELLLARQEVHYKWKQFHELAMKEKDKELEKEMEKTIMYMREKDKEKEMEKTIMYMKENKKEKERALKEMEKTMMYMKDNKKEMEKTIMYMKEKEKEMEKTITDSVHNLEYSNREISN